MSASVANSFSFRTPTSSELCFEYCVVQYSFLFTGLRPNPWLYSPQDSVNIPSSNLSIMQRSHLTTPLRYFHASCGPSGEKQKPTDVESIPSCA